MRTASVQLRLVDHLARGDALPRNLVRDEEAAGNLELGVEQRGDLQEREALGQQALGPGPPRCGSGHQRDRVVGEQVDADFLEAECVRDPVAHGLQDRVRGERLRQPRGDVHQLLQGRAMPLADDRRLRSRERLRSVMGETDEQSELFVARPQARRRVAERKDPQQLIAWSVERHEDFVIRVPRLRMVVDLADGDVALAGVVFPVELAVLDEERAVAEEAVVEELRPAFPAVGAAKQRALNFLVAVDGRDQEVVPLTAIEVEDDSAEAEHFRNRPRDQREDGREIALRPHELGDSDERADPRELARIPAPRACEQTLQSSMPSVSRSDDFLAADRTVLLWPRLPTHLQHPRWQASWNRSVGGSGHAGCDSARVATRSASVLRTGSRSAAPDRSRTRKNASTTTGANWVPRFLRSSASASSGSSARW